MNTTLKFTIIAAVVIAALALAGTGLTWAQSMSPWGGNGYSMMGRSSYQAGMPGYGFGMMGGGYGMMGNGAGMNGVDTAGMHQWMAASGGMHTVVWGGLAETLGLTPDELNAQIAGGQTLTQIAEAQGVSQEQLTAALETSVKAGLEKAVTDGTLTQEQADQMLSAMSGNFGWMLAHMGGLGNSFGPGNCHGNFGPQNKS